MRWFPRGPPPFLLGLKWLGRGDIKVLVLESLKSGPKRGYEVIKSIREMFGGWYAPSPGAVYPTLQWLEEEGLVRSEEVEGKRVYSITEEGLRFLAEKKDLVEGFRDRWRRATSPEGVELLDAARRLGMTVLASYTKYPEERLREVIRILEDARRRIMELDRQGE
jgi:DNA-binding PadR family transcriptional regulator